MEATGFERQTYCCNCGWVGDDLPLLAPCPRCGADEHRQPVAPPADPHLVYLPPLNLRGWRVIPRRPRRNDGANAERTRRSDERRRLVRTARESGRRFADIAETLEITEQHARLLLREDRAEQAIELRRQGVNDSDIAQAVGLPESKVEVVIRAHLGRWLAVQRDRICREGGNPNIS